MGIVKSLPSGHLRTFDLFCLNVARDSLAHASKLPALPCWRQTANRTGGKVEKQRDSTKPQIYKINQEKVDPGRIFTKLLSRIVFTLYTVLCFTQVPLKIKT